MSATIEDSVIGRVVGPYRVLDRLAGDAGSLLYVAEHLHLDRKVALRLIATDAAGVFPGLDRFLADARKLSRVKHDNVAGLVDVGQAGDGHIYLALELPEGRTLDRVIAEHGPLAGARARIIGRQIGAGMVAAARESLLHRDVALGEIFIGTKDGRDDAVKIDFGTADMLASEPVVEADGVRMLGGLLYQMVVGQPPVAAANEAPPDPMLARPDLEVPTDLEVLIMRALHPDKSKRWPDIESMLRVLAAAEQRAATPGAGVEHGGGSMPTPTRPVPIHGGTWFARPSPRALLAGGVAATVALILGIALGTARRRAEPLRQAVGEAVGGAVGEAANVPASPPSMAAKASGGDQAAGAAPATPPETTPPAVAAAAAAAVAGAGATGGLGGSSRPSTTLAARAATEAGGPRRDAGPLSEARRGVAGQGGIAIAVPPRDDQARAAAAAGRPSGGDDACAVTLGSRPWSEVWIDGRQAGFTPLIDYPIDCGPHDVVFKSSESDIEKRVAIVVAPGQAFKKIVDLTGARPGPMTAAADKVGASEPAAGAATGTATGAGTGAVAGAASGSGCLVTLGSRPWSEIWIDGKHVGVTPLVEYGLSCGKHEVIFRSTDPVVERREAIVLQSGRTLKKVVILVEAPPP